jgi:hypothetical protein
MTTITAADAPTQELRVPPAVAEWPVEQHAAQAEGPPRPPSPGCHDLEACRRLMRLPKGWPHVKIVLAELTNDGLEYDEYGVIVVRPASGSSFRRHAARHTARGAS